MPWVVPRTIAKWHVSCLLATRCVVFPSGQDPHCIHLAYPACTALVFLAHLDSYLGLLAATICPLGVLTLRCPGLSRWAASALANILARTRAATSATAMAPVGYISDSSSWLALMRLAENETAVMRFNYGDPYLGTCQESIKGMSPSLQLHLPADHRPGGNHFRYWVQNGKDANTGAIFMACSAEKSAAEFHDIVPDGYNIGRDWIVGNATAHPGIATAQLTAGTEYVGSTVFAGYTYQTTATYVAGLLGNTSDGVNHFQSVPIDGRAAMDGLVAVLTVRITGVPEGAAKPNHATDSSDGALQRTWSAPVALLLLAVGVVSLC